MTIRTHLKTSTSLHGMIENPQNEFFQRCNDTFEYLGDVEKAYLKLFGKIFPPSLYRAVCHFHVTHPDLTSPVAK